MIDGYTINGNMTLYRVHCRGQSVYFTLLRAAFRISYFGLTAGLETKIPSNVEYGARQYAKLDPLLHPAVMPIAGA